MAIQPVMLLTWLVFVAVSAGQKRSDANVLTVNCKGDSCPHSTNDTPVTLRPFSCLDYLKQGALKCGIYQLYDSSGNSFPAYCDMKSEPGMAWTLVMSWSQAFSKLGQFQKSPFQTNAPVNENSHNWNVYRLSLPRMKSLQSHSTHWRATCSYNTYGVDFTDYVRGNFKDFEILNFLGANQCKKVEYINIRGHIGIHTTAKFWQVVKTYLLHIDSSYSGCQFDPRSGSVSSEDNFGYYARINPKFRCTDSPQSTTQWWFGGHL